MSSVTIRKKLALYVLHILFLLAILANFDLDNWSGEQFGLPNSKYFYVKVHIAIVFFDSLHNILINK